MSEGQSPSGSPEMTPRFRAVGLVVRPEQGWIRTVRESLGLTLTELSRRLHVTPPAIRSFEQAEAEDRITLASLRRAADAMDCDLIYALVPREGAQSTLLDETPATENAAKKVTDLTWRTQHGEM